MTLGKAFQSVLVRQHALAQFGYDFLITGKPSLLGFHVVPVLGCFAFEQPVKAVLDRRGGDRRGNGERRPYNNDRRSYNGERRPYNNNNTEGGNR